MCPMRRIDDDPTCYDLQVHCLPTTIHRSLLTIHYSLFTIHHSLFTIHYSLFTIHYSLFTIHYSLSNLQCHQRQYSQHYSHDPKARHNFRLCISQLLIVMMQWRHLKNSSSFTILSLRVFEITHLYHDREALHEKNPAENWNEQLFSYNNGHGGDDATKSK